ncbi:serine hydrolase [uncultured Winogradskyella sp.]|jgi:CubicO group peptidase (beta-lactamase class C family)|uniref:serine hydrolase domain-containing protein n=1 Tax=uncultured Winogradskyella sp. TaxID=395353 RepID=UPI0025EEE22A|nr:serine hydrolase [uncultured Winogradskyella sp.]MDC3260295.1 beta-lactamase family protein [Winogradskyella sp.]
MFPTKTLFSFILLVSFYSVSAQVDYFPERNAIWLEKTPSELNVDLEWLNDAVDFAKENEYSGSRDLRIAILKGFAREPFHEILGPTKKRGGPAGLILKDGYVVAKWGDTKRVDMTFSVTKSFLSTVTGLGIDKGLITNETDFAKDYIWDGTFDGRHNSKITWQHLLQQNSDWSGELWGGKDWADRPPREGDLDDWKNRALKEPGTHMEYNDVRVNVLAYSALHVWRKPLPQVLKEEVMDKIGASTTWRWFGYENAWTTIDGLKMKSVTGGGHSGAGLFISAEDMARFGVLFLNNGKWKNEQLISEDWIQRAITPSQPNVNYGYMWWLNKKGPRHWENVSEDIYYAAGFGGNFIVVDRTHNVVVVTRWLEPSKVGEFMQKLTKALD